LFVKFLIIFQLKNEAKSVNITKWSFLSGEEFYRINEDADESLLDIVSTDSQIIYILKENYHELDENVKHINESINKKVKLVYNDNISNYLKF
jgi:hypothetical protein